MDDFCFCNVQGSMAGCPLKASNLHRLRSRCEARLRSHACATPSYCDGQPASRTEASCRPKHQASRPFYLRGEGSILLGASIVDSVAIAAARPESTYRRLLAFRRIPGLHHPAHTSKALPLPYCAPVSLLTLGTRLHSPHPETRISPPFNLTSTGSCGEPPVPCPRS